MEISQKIIKFLEKGKIKYQPIKHKTVYTAYDKAKTLKVLEKTIGKTLIVKLDKKPALILISANKNLEKEKLKKLAKVKKIDFLKENWMKKNLKGIKVGAISPFGNLWGLATFVDKTLFKESYIIVNGGNYNWSIKIKSSDFKKLMPDLIAGSFSKKKK